MSASLLNQELKPGTPAPAARRKTALRHITYSAILLALAILLPFLTGQIPEIGRVLSPMHIPAMLAGFMLPWPWALGVSFIMPLVRSLLFSIPPMVPMAVTMAFELAAYALVISLLKRRLARNTAGIFAALIIAMVIGRIVYILAFYAVMNLSGGQFSLNAVVTGLTIDAIPALILQLILIPPVVLALRKARLIA